MGGGHTTYSGILHEASVFGTRTERVVVKRRLWYVDFMERGKDKRGAST